LRNLDLVMGAERRVVYDLINVVQDVVKLPQAPARAYTAAARRLAGEGIEMTIPTDRKGFFDKLFGRRAA
jgi:septum formation inhibitor-activating ATPase MinD